MDAFAFRFEVLRLRQAHDRRLVFEPLVIERDAHAERGGGTEECIELHFGPLQGDYRSSIRNGMPRVNAGPFFVLPLAAAAPCAALFPSSSSAGCRRIRFPWDIRRARACRAHAAAAPLPAPAKPGDRKSVV